MATLDFQMFNGTPGFIIAGSDPKYTRVHAGTYDKKRTRWIFPAYPPFGPLVISDLRTVDKTLQYSPAAEQYMRELAELPRRLQDRELPSQLTYHTRPLDHQMHGLTLFHHHPRFALWWEPGCGKSKVAIDAFRAARLQDPTQKLLILSQKVTLDNWVKEVKIHGGGELNAIALTGSTAEKREALLQAADYDIIVASYGTARTMGLPEVHKDTEAFLKELTRQGKPLTESGRKTLMNIVKRVALPDDQKRLATLWADGVSFVELDRIATTEAAKSVQWLENLKYNRILVDESQNIKDQTAQQTKVIVELSKKASHRELLSGTPTSGNPTHFYPQMKFLSPAIFPEDWFRFSDLFLERSPHNRRIVTGFKNLDVINERVGRVSDTKKKADCLDLPERTFIDIKVKMSAEQRRLYNTLVTAMGADLQSFFDKPSGSDLEVQNAATLLNKLGQVCSGFILDKGNKTTLCDGCEHLRDCVDASIVPYTALCKKETRPPPTSANYLKENPKLAALTELLDDLLADPKRKVIIWAYYHAELNQIQELLQERQWGFVRMDGETTKPQQKVDKFNEDPTCQVYLGQVSTGVGITLNAATYMVYYCLDWKMDLYLQSLDRNYRVGQHQKTTVYRLLMQDTVEEYKVKALDQKQDLSAILTSKLACVGCKKRYECLQDGVSLFDPGCLYKRSAKRTIAHAEVLK
jgi:SNF2 family DNA or RNA helicase